MKKHWIKYATTWSKYEPMTYWVHIEANGGPWYDAGTFCPPAPLPVPGRGFPVYHVEIDGFTFRFSSLAELDVCIETFSRRLLPSPIRLTETRHSGGHWCLNHHWLSRLPGKVKSWRYRQKAVKYLSLARENFRKQVASKYRGDSEKD